MHASVAHIMADPALNSVYRLQQSSDLLPTLDGRALDDKDVLLEALGWALELPDYYGANWDALEECLMDMSWQSGPVLLQIEHADRLPQDLMLTLMDIFSDAADFWRGENRVCSLFLVGIDASDLAMAH